MKFFGLEDEIPVAPSADESEQDVYQVWPENVQTLNLFLSLRHRWVIVAAPDGEMVKTGLRSHAIQFKLENTNGLPKCKWPDVIADLEAMEDAVLAIWNQARVERRRRREEELEEARLRAGR